MEKDEEELRQKLNYHILYNIHPALGAFPPEEPPLLGDDFAYSAQRFFEEVSAFRKRAVQHLSALPLETIRTGFSRYGEPLTEEQQTWCLVQRQDFRRRFNWVTSWQLALVEKDRTSAKYDHWAKAAYLSPEEALWLTVGLEPLPEFKRALDQRASSPGRDAAVDHMLGLLDRLRRKFGSERKLAAKSVVDWANSVGHALHPGFIRMVEGMVTKAPTSPEPEPAPETGVVTKRMDPREDRSMAARRQTRSQPRSLPSTAKLNSAKSRALPDNSRRTLMDRTCRGMSGRFWPIMRPLFQGTRAGRRAGRRSMDMGLPPVHRAHPSSVLRTRA